MNFLGMGPLEILVVLFIAFVVLGPERMMDMGKKAGRLVGDLRRMNSGLRDTLTLDDEEDRRVSRPASERSDGEDPADGPVAFRAGGDGPDGGPPTAGPEPDVRDDGRDGGADGSGGAR